MDSFKDWANHPPPSGIISLEHDLFEASARVAPTAINEMLYTNRFTALKISECRRDPAYGNVPLTALFSRGYPMAECTRPVFYPARLTDDANVYGFENGKSCVIGPNTPHTPTELYGFPVCKEPVYSPAVDQNGFKYGSDGGRSCIVAPIGR